MYDVNTSSWTAVGQSSNSRYFAVEPGILAAVPNPGAIDDRQSAEENVTFQNNYFREQGRGGVVLVFFDRMASQDKEARRVYGMLPEENLMRATALVGGSLLGRAIASFFLGISKPRIPVKLFGTTEEAIAWARQLNQAKDANR